MFKALSPLAWAEPYLEKLDLSIPEHKSVPQIEDIVANSAVVGGKRLRPLLCLAFGKLFGKQADELLAFARLAELTHSATLVHDDIIDDAKERRGHRTINEQYSNAQAVLIGDTLIARIMLEMAELDQPVILKDLAICVDDLTRGEWMQLENRFQTNISRNNLEQIAIFKTGALMRFSCLVGARLSGAHSSLVEDVKNWGEHLGLLFQLTDDFIDYSGAEKKDANKDIKEGLINFTTLDIIEAFPEEEEKIRLAWNENEPLEFKPTALDAGLQNLRSRIQAKSLKLQADLKKIYSSMPSTPASDEAFQDLKKILFLIEERVR